MMWRIVVGAWAVISLAGCPGTSSTGPEPEAEPEVQFGETLGLSACDTATADAHPDMECKTFRTLAGVSMGGGTAARLGFTYPELFDVVGIMGTPFADNEFFWGVIKENFMGGFCPLDQLEDLIANEGPEAINDRDNPLAFCGTHDVYPLEGGQQVSKDFPAVEGSECYFFRSDYNHWYRGPDAGRGGTFSRNGLIEIFHDIVMAYGNPFYYNEADPYFPPGVSPTWHVPPQDNAFDRQALCNNPITISGMYNREYNPDGSYDVITYCEGSDGDSGAYDPAGNGRYRNVIEYTLAVDLNGNGLRDYGEPLVINDRERYLDYGLDGLKSEDEPGYDPDTNPDPAGDDYDPMTNPNGFEHNFTHDEGEAYDDDGLDGVPATGDYGEGNGTYDLSPVLQRIFDRSPGLLFSRIDDTQVDRLDIWIDAGIRDFINSAQITNALYSKIAARQADSTVYNDFRNLPGVEGGYAYYKPDYTRDGMGQVAYLRYGKPETCPNTDEVLGDGNHVGPDIIHRIYTLISFISARVPPQGRDNYINGVVSDLGSPNGSLTDYGELSSYYSEALGRDMAFGVSLPPDYYLEEERDYPVMYFFHGQGQSADDMVAIGYVLFGNMKEAAKAERSAEGYSDFQKMILVWVDGDCIGDDCWTGNFYADFEGLPRKDRNFEQAFIELVNHIETNYRVKKPELVPR